MDKDSILRAAVKAAEEMEKQPLGHAIPLQPVPTGIQISPITSPQGEKFVLITLTTPVGQNSFFFDPENADKIADGLKDAARLSRTGLEIAR